MTTVVENLDAAHVFFLRVGDWCGRVTMCGERFGIRGKGGYTMDIVFGYIISLVFLFCFFLCAFLGLGVLKKILCFAINVDKEVLFYCLQIALLSSSFWPSLEEEPHSLSSSMHFFSYFIYGEQSDNCISSLICTRVSPSFYAEDADFKSL